MRSNQFQDQCISFLILIIRKDHDQTIYTLHFFPQSSPISIILVLPRQKLFILTLLLFLIVKHMSSQSYINHSLNASKSKQANSFSRAPRFSTLTKPPTETIYALPTTNSKRATSFGFGCKLTLVNKERSPPPGSYNIPSGFSKDNLLNATTLHEGRDRVTFGSFLLETLKRKKHVPSPDKYYVPSPYNTIGGRMGERIQTEYSIKHRNTPGPGTYKLNSIELGNKGHYVLSNFKNSTSPRYHSGHNLTANKSKHPPPFYYDVQQKQVGRHPTSSYPNAPSCSFSRAVRPSPADRSKVSIPGAKYRSFSQFGS